MESLQAVKLGGIPSMQNTIRCIYDGLTQSALWCWWKCLTWGPITWLLSCMDTVFSALFKDYRQTTNISHTLVGNKLVAHSGERLAVLLQLHLHSRLNTWLQWTDQRQLQDVTTEHMNLRTFNLGFIFPSLSSNLVIWTQTLLRIGASYIYI